MGSTYFSQSNRDEVASRRGGSPGSAALLLLLLLVVVVVGSLGRLAPAPSPLPSAVCVPYTARAPPREVLLLWLQPLLLLLLLQKQPGTGLA